MKRYLVWHGDFDTRSFILSTEIKDTWESDVKKQWHESKKQISNGLAFEFGALDLPRKIQDFIDIGDKPFSIVAHHNAFFAQTRNSFVQGAYYPALTGACALGERILNHLVIDMRDDFKSTPEYKIVYRKDSFDDWQQAVSVLRAWDVFQVGVDDLFLKLASVRHRSIHFNPSTAENLRDEALSAIHLLREIIHRQFGSFGSHTWALKGTKGQCFIKQSSENDVFLKRYYLPQCLLVGINFSIAFDQHGQAMFFDFEDYGHGNLTDEEFCERYNNRKPTDLAPTEDQFRLRR